MAKKLQEQFLIATLNHSFNTTAVYMTAVILTQLPKSSDLANLNRSKQFLTYPKHSMYGVFAFINDIYPSTTIIIPSRSLT